MLISEYDKKNVLDKNDKLVLETSAGTKSMTGENLANSIYDILKEEDRSLAPTLQEKRTMYRGQAISGRNTMVTETQRAAIANGSFDDIYLGDYWWYDIPGGDPQRVKFTVVDFDYWYGYNISHDESIADPGRHHVVVMCDYNRGTTIPYQGPYATSTVRDFVSDISSSASGWNSIVKQMVGFNKEYLLYYPEYLETAEPLNDRLTYSLCQCGIEVPTVGQIMGDGFYDFTALRLNNSMNQCFQRQFALYKLRPELRNWFTVINNKKSEITQPYWLRDSVLSMTTENYNHLAMNALYKRMNIAAYGNGSARFITRFMFGMTGE